MNQQAPGIDIPVYSSTERRPPAPAGPPDYPKIGPFIHSAYPSSGPAGERLLTDAEWEQIRRLVASTPA